MKYLIINNNEVFYTNWFDKDNNYVPGMIVVNLLLDEYTTDGVKWQTVEEDSL